MAPARQLLAAAILTLLAASAPVTAQSTSCTAVLPPGDRVTYDDMLAVTLIAPPNFVGNANLRAAAPRPAPTAPALTAASRSLRLRTVRSGKAA